MANVFGQCLHLALLSLMMRSKCDQIHDVVFFETCFELDSECLRPDSINVNGFAMTPLLLKEDWFVSWIFAECLLCRCLDMVPVPLTTNVFGQYLHLHLDLLPSMRSKCDQTHDDVFFEACLELDFDCLKPVFLSFCCSLGINSTLSCSTGVGDVPFGVGDGNPLAVEVPDIKNLL